MTLPPPALPADAKYRPIHRTAPTEHDRYLTDLTPLTLPRGILKALCAQLFHACTPVQRPLGRTGICRACDLIELAKTYSTVIE